MRPKGENYNKVVSLRRNNPCALLDDIARQVGLTRERVRQILKESGRPTRHYIPPKEKFYCSSCGKPSVYPVCFDCRKQQSWVEIACNSCGKLNKYLISRVIWEEAHKRHTHLYFCDKICQGRWFGEHYGFGAYPEHSNKSVFLRKWNYNLVWQTHLDTGYGCWKLARLLEISKAARYTNRHSKLYFTEDEE